jgi:hypothetical protein
VWIELRGIERSAPLHRRTAFVGLPTHQNHVLLTGVARIIFAPRQIVFSVPFGLWIPASVNEQIGVLVRGWLAALLAPMTTPDFLRDTDFSLTL